jgi:hypothetical protein
MRKLQEQLRPQNIELDINDVPNVITVLVWLNENSFSRSFLTIVELPATFQTFIDYRKEECWPDQLIISGQQLQYLISPAQRRSGNAVVLSAWRSTKLLIFRWSVLHTLTETLDSEVLNHFVSMCLALYDYLFPTTSSLASYLGTSDKCDKLPLAQAMRSSCLGAHNNNLELRWCTTLVCTSIYMTETLEKAP